MIIRLAYIFLTFCLLFAGCGKKKVRYDHSFKFHSRFSGHEYQVDVIGLGGKGLQKIFYVLDGRELVPVIKKQLEKIKTDKSLLFVAINYPGKNQRTRDYTISETEKGTGQAQAFLSFIRHQVDSQLSAQGLLNPAAERGIIGHSLGGLFASYSFCAANNFFKNYVIMSPALFYDNYRFFEIEQAGRDSIRNNHCRVFLGVGKAEDLGMANSFEALKEIIIKEYRQVDLSTAVHEGSHYESRDNAINEGLMHLIK